MEPRDIKLKAGDLMQMQALAKDNSQRHYVKLIGYVPGQSILVTTPRVNGKIVLVSEGQAFAVRLLAGNSVLGFTANVLRSSTRPYPYLHLSYPKEMQESVVRKAHRVGVDIIAAVRNDTREGAGADSDDEPMAAVIRDLSTAGLLMCAEEPLGAVDDLLSVTARYVVGNINEDLRLSGVIRNVEKTDETDSEPRQYRYGLEFQFLEREESMTLHAFVFQQIVLGAAEH